MFPQWKMFCAFQDCAVHAKGNKHHWRRLNQPQLDAQVTFMHRKNLTSSLLMQWKAHQTVLIQALISSWMKWDWHFVTHSSCNEQCKRQHCVHPDLGHLGSNKRLHWVWGIFLIVELPFKTGRQRFLTPGAKKLLSRCHQLVCCSLITQSKFWHQCEAICVLQMTALFCFSSAGFDWLMQKVEMVNNWKRTIWVNSSWALGWA